MVEMFVIGCVIVLIARIDVGCAVANVLDVLGNAKRELIAFGEMLSDRIVVVFVISTIPGGFELNEFRLRRYKEIFAIPFPFGTVAVDTN